MRKFHTVLAILLLCAAPVLGFVCSECEDGDCGHGAEVVAGLERHNEHRVAPVAETAPMQKPSAFAGSGSDHCRTKQGRTEAVVANEIASQVQLSSDEHSCSLQPASLLKALLPTAKIEGATGPLRLDAPAKGAETSALVFSARKEQAGKPSGHRSPSEVAVFMVNETFLL